MSTEPDVAREREGRNLGLLWLGLAIAPVAWALQLVASDLFVELGCRSLSSLHGWLIAITIVSAVAGAIGLLAAISARGRVGDDHDHANGTSGDRAMFMAMGGILGSSLFLLLILLGGFLPGFFLRSCGS